MQMKILTLVALLLGSLMPPLAMAAPDGRQIAIQGLGGAPCQACHGDRGQGSDAAGFPRLAGMNAEYLARQLHAFKTGSRQSPVMAPQAQALDDAAIAAVSRYYAGLPAPAASPAKVPAAQLQHGQTLATVGRWTDDIPACEQCHGPGGRGLAPHFPSLAGQHAGYLAGQISAWKQGQRRSDPNGLMAAVAKRLSDGDIKAVAAWFAAQPPRAQAADK
jgi:cytochrome c553